MFVLKSCFFFVLHWFLLPLKLLQSQGWQRNLAQVRSHIPRGLTIGLLILWLVGWGMPRVEAAIDDDRFDGNIFPLYAGNGSLVPPRTSLAVALQAHRPTLLLFYVDDSKDCKQNVIVMNQIQAFYTQSLSLIPVSVDSLRFSAEDGTDQEAYYYNGRFVPQWVLLDRSGQVVFNKIGQATYEQIDDLLREVFDLPPRSETFSLGNPEDFSPSPSADATFWTAPVKIIDSVEPSGN